VGSKRLHAERNEKLSDKLYTEGEFFDWCITTTFYSAIKFIQHHALPNQYNGTQCTTLDEFARAMNLKSETKHKITEILVETALPSIITEYRWLKDNSYNARYHDYEVSQDFAKLARKFLKKNQRQLPNQLKNKLQ
jgi:hypothetical protein